jgi:hypothetical protein
MDIYICTSSDIRERCRQLGTTVAGHTLETVEQMRAKYGPNATPPAPKPGLLMKIWDQVSNILIVVLIVVSGEGMLTLAIDLTHFPASMYH